MDRRQWLTDLITPEQRGIEIGPYFNPLVPKKKGFNSIIIDIADQAQLRAWAARDPLIPKSSIDLIEEVDLLGTSTEIAELVATKYSLGSFDYIISSHNLEHMPDPIRFLQSCQKVLRPTGVIALAIPDRRACFDYFRPRSTLADWLEAYFAKRQRPSASQVFSQHALRSYYLEDGKQLGGFTLSDDPSQIYPHDSLAAAFQSYAAFEASPNEVYQDVHCWAFTPSSLELILRELNQLGLIQLEIQQVTATYNCEFFIRLSNTKSKTPLSAKAFHEQRCELLHRIHDEEAVSTRRAYKDRNGALPSQTARNPSDAADWTQAAQLSHLERLRRLIGSSRSNHALRQAKRVFRRMVPHGSRREHAVEQALKTLLPTREP